MKIVSLLPAATEIVEHLGREDDLIAVSHACHPRDPLVPPLTRSRVPVGLDATETDRCVRALLSRGEPLFELDEELLMDLRPDVVIAQSLCNVCAIDGNQIRRAVETLGGATRLVEWSPNTLDDVIRGIMDIGSAIDAEREGQVAATVMRRDLFETCKRSSLQPNTPQVVFLEWLNPLFCAGHWIPELVQLAGGQELLGKPGGRSREISPSEIIAADPDVIIACCCGWSVEQSAAEMIRLERSDWFRALKAYQTRRIYVVDALADFTMPTQRLATACHMLDRLINGNQNAFANEHAQSQLIHIPSRTACETAGIQAPR